MNGGEFLESYIPLWHGVFQFDIFLELFSVNCCVFPLSDLLRVLILLSSCLSIRLFVVFSWLPYFSPNSFVFYCIRLLVCFRVISSHLLVEFSFVVLECPVNVCIVLPIVDTSLIFLLFARTLWFIFSSYMFQRLSFVLSFWPVLVDFLSAFPVEFPIMNLIFSSCSLRGSQFSH